MHWHDLKVGDHVFRAEIVMMPTGDVVRVIEYEVRLLGKRFFEFFSERHRLRYAYSSYGGLVAELAKTETEALDILDQRLLTKIENGRQRFDRMRKEVCEQRELLAAYRKKIRKAG